MQKFIATLIKKSIGLYINLLSYSNPPKATRLAYKFFSEPREGRLIKEQLPEMLRDAITEMISFDDDVFQVYTWKGNDKKVLLVHGWESNTSRWEQFMPYLKKSGCTVIAVDAPAHGLSSGNEFNIPRYAQFIDVVVQKLNPHYLVGHSLGGATALYYQSHYANESIEKLVLLGAPSDLRVIVTNYLGMLGLNQRVYKLMENHFYTSFEIKTDEFAGGLFAKKLKIKGLLAHDETDKVVSFSEAKKIAAAWPEAEFIVTNGLGHSMHDDKLYSRIYDFLFKE